jgi:hypothetical protein
MNNYTGFDRNLLSEIFGKMCGSGIWDDSVHANEKNRFHANVVNLLKDW